MRKLKPIQIYLASLILINIILTLFLAYDTSSASNFCLTGQDCRTVQDSSYGTLFGIKLGLLGAIAFTFLLIIYFFSMKRTKLYPLFFLATYAGTLWAIYFIAIQVFVLKKLCSSCILVDSIMIIISALSLYELNQLRKSY